jgi:hypothetical protein
VCYNIFIKVIIIIVIAFRNEKQQQQQGRGCQPNETKDPYGAMPVETRVENRDFQGNYYLKWEN